jgi:hypothetical protein
LADTFCRLVEASGILGHLIWSCHSKMCSFTLGHWIIPFLSILVVQIGTMKCFYCPQKDASVVPWDSLTPDDQNFLRDKYPDAGQGAVCYLCVRSAHPSAFFSHHSSSTSSSAPKMSGFWAATAFGSSSCVWCSYVFGHRVNVPMHCAHALCRTLSPCTVPMHCAHAVCPCSVPMYCAHVPMHCAIPCAHALCPCVESGVVEPSASVAESSTAATGSGTGSHQIDHCRTALVADQSHRVCCTPTQHTVRWEWEACLHSSSSGKLCLCSENHFSP